MKRIEILLALTLGCLIFMGYALADQYHPASELRAGTFGTFAGGPYDYKFPGSLNVTGPLNIERFLRIWNWGANPNFDLLGTGKFQFIKDANVFSPLMTLDNAGNLYVKGNVGIGTPSPAIKLAIGDTDTGLHWLSDGNLAIYTNNVERMRIDSAGGVGIGKAPSWKLDVAGTVNAEALRSTGGADITGNLNVGGKTNIFVPVVPWTVIDCGGGSSWTGTCDFTVDTSYSAVMLAVRPDIRSDRVIVGFYTGSGGTGTKIGWIRTPTGFKTNGIGYFYNPAYTTVVLSTTVKSAKIEEHGDVWDYGSDWGDNIIIMGYLR